MNNNNNLEKIEKNLEEINKNSKLIKTYVRDFHFVLCAILIVKFVLYVIAV